MAVTDVVMVGGFMASSLRWEDHPPVKELFWLDSFNLARYGSGPLQLAANGINPGPLAGDRELTPSSLLVAPSIYQPAIQKLQNSGFTVHWQPYDWRKTMHTAANDLAQFCIGNFSGRDFALIGHSMGGLVARLAYPIYRAAQGEGTWKRTIHVGVPQYGSYHAAQYLALTSDLLALFGWKGQRVIGFDIESKIASALRPYLKTARLVVATWPGLYELLPSAQGGWAQYDPLAAQLYLPGNYNPPQPNATQLRFNDAVATRQAIDATLTTPRPQELTIAGTGVRTPVKVQRAFGFNEDEAYLFGDGDGAIPENRVRLTGAIDVLDLEGCEHGNLLAHPAFLAAIGTIVLGNDTVPATIPAIPQDAMLIPPPVVRADLPARFPPEVQIRGDP